MPPSVKSPSYFHYLLAAGIALIIFAAHQFHFLDFHEPETLDMRFLLRGARPAHSDIVLVEIDDASVQNLGAWPWPRTIHAGFLKALARYKPRSVIYDILFTQAGSVQAEDEELASAIEKAGQVILPFYYYSQQPFQTFSPIRSLQESARGTGFANLAADRDGKIRRLRLSIKTAEDIFYPLPVLAAINRFVDEERSRDWLERIPTDPSNHFWINYPGPSSSFQKISFFRVLNGVQNGEESFLKRLLENRMVLVGKTVPEAANLQPTPFSRESEIVIQASALHTLLSGKYLRSTHRYLDLFIVCFLALAACGSAKVHSPRLSFFSMLGLMGGYAAFNILAFNFAGWILPFCLPLAAMAVIYILILIIEAIEIRLHGELMDQELDTAARIQETFLPRPVPVLENLDIDVECRFARQVGGDLYDWIDFGDGNFGICVGDVSGKGIPAAIYMARAISDFRRENKSGLQPGELCRAMNLLLTRDMGHNTGMFLTLIYAVVNARRRKLRVASAAHMPMIFFHQRLRRAEILLGDKVVVGKPLGLFPDAAYQTVELTFEPGDYFILLSDGIKEARNEKGREFGLERVRKLMEEYAGVPAEELINQLFYSLAAFQKGLPLHDDCTAVCVRFRSEF